MQPIGACFFYPADVLFQIKEGAIDILPFAGTILEEGIL